MSAFCQFLSDKSITSYPPSFSGEVLRDTFKAKDRFTVRIGSEKNRSGTRKQPVIECQSDVYAVSQSYKQQVAQFKCWRVVTGTEKEKL